LHEESDDYPAAIFLWMGVFAAHGATAGGNLPTILILGSLSKVYEPVRFNHAEHVSLAGGCGDCHHQHRLLKIQTCSECHRSIPPLSKRTLSPTRSCLAGIVTRRREARKLRAAGTQVRLPPGLPQMPLGRCGQRREEPGRLHEVCHARKSLRTGKRKSRESWRRWTERPCRSRSGNISADAGFHGRKVRWVSTDGTS